MENVKPTYEELVYDWGNELIPRTFNGFVDETIRDGLQSPYIRDLVLGDKLKIIEMMSKTRPIKDVIIGMSGMGLKNKRNLEHLLRSCSEFERRLQPWILSRNNQDDINEVCDINKHIESNMGINLFLSVSKIRLFVESWDLNTILNNLFENVTRCKENFKEIRVAIEDATRTEPKILKMVILNLVSIGVTRIVIADTAGVATPLCVKNIFDYIKSFYKNFGQGGVLFEWHGHNDKGLAVANSLQSIFSGASYVHGTMMGIGERNGNAALDTIMFNIRENRYDEKDWIALKEYYLLCEKLFKKPTHESYPFMGRNTFSSSTGTHCAAIKKAIDKGSEDIARKLFSPPSYLSNIETPIFLVSHLSGRKSVEGALNQMGMNGDEEMISKILDFAKKHRKTLKKEELLRIVKQ